MRHLNNEEMAGLLAGKPDAVVYFREHLSSSCEICVSYMEQSDGKHGWLDAEADRLLLRASSLPKESEEGVERGFERVRRTMRRRRAARIGSWSGAVALAASVCVVVFFSVRQAGSRHGTSEWIGEKGAGAATVLELKAATLSPGGELRATSPDERISAARSLVFRYHASRSGNGFLVVERQGKPAEFLGQFPLSSGTHDVRTSKDSLSAVSLQGESGQLVFWLIHGPPDLDAKSALSAVEGRPTPNVSLARFPVQVVPGEDER